MTPAPPPPPPGPPPLAGALHDLARIVRTHLFVVCPNNSGSSYLAAALATCRAVWSLPAEGQHVHGFTGPATRYVGRLTWAADPATLAHFTDAAAFDWAETQRAWYFQARGHAPDGSVLAVKSPPFCVQCDQLVRAFPDARFVIMVRNPYAAAEGILRRPHAMPPGADPVDRAARHLLTCLEHQRRNIAAHGARAVAFTYEALCADPDGQAARVRALVPALDDLAFGRRLAVKGLYDEPLRDMNAAQIARLSPGQIAGLSRVFAERPETLAAFGYPIL